MFGILKIELRKSLTRTNAAILTVFILFAALIQQVAIQKYKSQIQKKETFIRVENRKVGRYSFYMQYGVLGFRVFFLSSPIASIFNNSTTISNLQADIDSNYELTLNRPEIGRSLFEKPTGGNLDLSWYILWLGSILILTWGFYSFRNSGYIKFLMNFSRPIVVYLGMIVSRILLIVLSALIIGIVFCLQFYSNGFLLNISEMSDIFLFLLVAAAIMIFSLVAGAIFGTIRNRLKGSIISVFFWLIVVILWPEALNLTFSERGLHSIKPIYEHEIEKLDIFIRFEEMASRYSTEKGYKTREERLRADKELSEHYWNNEYPKMERADSRLIEEIEGDARKFHLWSILNPITFYRSVNNELSSRGYNGYIEFYRDIQEKKRGFTRFYIDKKNQPGGGKVVPYLSGEEYIFRSKSSLPNYFGAGAALNLGYILVLLFFCYFRFKKALFPPPLKATSFEEISYDFEHGKHYTITTNVDNDDFVNQLYNTLSGKQPKGFDGKITVAGKIVESGEKIVYLPYPNEIPAEIKAYTLLSLVPGLTKAEMKSLKEQLEKRGIKNKLWKELPNQEKADVMLHLVRLKESKTYLLDEFFFGLPMALKVGLLDTIRELKQGGVLIVDTISRGIPHKHFDSYSAVHFDGLNYSAEKFGG